MFCSFYREYNEHLFRKFQVIVISETETPMILILSCFFYEYFLKQKHLLPLRHFELRTCDFPGDLKFSNQGFSSIPVCCGASTKYFFRKLRTMINYTNYKLGDQ